MTNTDVILGRPAKRVLAFSGSARKGSWNSLLLSIAADAMRSHGVSVSEISLRDHALPLYDGDLEETEGVPQNAFELRRLIHEHDGLLIACPEYNGSVTPLLKNALDWCSRSGDGLDGLEPFQLKPVLIVGTSIGPFGALRAIGHLRAIMSKMGAVVVPEDLALPNAQAAFQSRALADRNMDDVIRALTCRLAEHLPGLKEKRS
ncbi:NADPH-dependent FMN reductase [Rhizobium laguerreae]|uniref:NADPH-dependent FMN reductase n=1 Tax=Rhizobium laguerreae TaxID=1076926 RepID=UPI001C91B770|nr:NAD(P)H-dependent oxidoreductase [Rhizobium laguerreae]MBY3422505.1 NAD(P)H-dependent oxidoreductase [Rhizobium laguerreae]MBY3569066.1 NAD(P)H-dependent oxidoreductase [Rhizobium laguerreae]